MKNIKTILFDLDGTLLPMNFDHFTKIYFGEMGKHFYNVIEPKLLVENIWAATKTMVSNTESKTNEQVFWESFNKLVNNNPELSREAFLQFYNNGYMKSKEATYISQHMLDSVKKLKESGYEVVIATNPLFPKKAIYDRIKWAGFEPESFRYITSFEDNHFCKPQTDFYREVLEQINRKPEECLMVGNDVQEDMVAGELGIKTWLITDCLIHKKDGEPKADYVGTYEEFGAFVEDLTKGR